MKCSESRKLLYGRTSLLELAEAMSQQRRNQGRNGQKFQKRSMEQGVRGLVFIRTYVPRRVWISLSIEQSGIELGLSISKCHSCQVLRLLLPVFLKYTLN